MKKRLLIGLLLSILIGSAIIWNPLRGGSNINANKKPSSLKVVTSPRPVISKAIIVSPTLKPVYISAPKPLPTITPTSVVYQNYGWYTHDGKNMQYFNGAWFSEPQQNITPVQQSAPAKACPDNLSESWCQACKNNNLDYNGCFLWYRRSTSGY
jgi:hypothetical protein